MDLHDHRMGMYMKSNKSKLLALYFLLLFFAEYIWADIPPANVEILEKAQKNMDSEMKKIGHEFCLRVRKWMKVSKSVSQYFYLLAMNKRKWSIEDEQIIISWIKSGQAHALSAIFYHEHSKQKKAFEQLLTSIFHDQKEMLCPLPCDYDHFEQIASGLDQKAYQRLKENCMPSCKIKRNTAESTAQYCDCAINGIGCEKLGISATFEIMKTNKEHKSLLSNLLRGTDKLLFQS